MSASVLYEILFVALALSLLISFGSESLAHLGSPVLDFTFKCVKYHNRKMWKKKLHPELKKSDLVRRIPLACADETAAVEFIEAQRWDGSPSCAQCGAKDVVQMQGRDGGRNKRFLWFCRSCKKQFTVRIGTVFEESKLPLRHWCYGFWREASSKKGVSALELMRHCQITHKSALFLLHRIRWAMAPSLKESDPLDGIVEADETYVGGKPRYKGVSKRGRGTLKTPVFACVQRGGGVRVKVIANVTTATLQEAIREVTAPTATVVTDELASYHGVGKSFAGGHHTVNHGSGEYVRKLATLTVHTNTAEGFFSIVKRGIHGIYHAVSKRHLHRYMAEFAWRYSVRDLNDGERTALLIRQAIGKRLMYREPVDGGENPPTIL